MESLLMKLSWNNWVILWITGFPAIQVNKESHFLEGAGKRISWELWEERILSTPLGRVDSWWLVLGLTNLKYTFRSPIWDFLWEVLKQERRGQGTNLKRWDIDQGHDINWLEPNGSKMENRLTSTRPWALVCCCCW